MAGLVAPMGSGVAQAQVEPGPGGTPPITVTMVRGPGGEPLAAPAPLDERPPRLLNGRGQVVTTTDKDSRWRGPVVLWHDGAATRISPEGATAHPTDISDSGQVVGDQASESELSFQTLPFSWQDGEWRTLPLPAGAFGAARAVNDAGQVLGIATVYNSDGVEQKVKVVAWSGGQLVEAPVDIEVTGPEPVDAVDINERGQALFNVTEWTPGSATGTAYLWDVGGGATEIGPVEAVAVNNRGQVVGRVGTDDGYHAVLWEDGVMTDLGTLGGSRSRAVDINERGQVVGISQTEAEDGWHAFLWEDGQMTDLGSHGLSAFAVDVNESGQVVGQAGTTTEAGRIETRAFLWQRGEMTDLGALLEPAPPGARARISAGIEINDRGQIAGSVTTWLDFSTPPVEETVLWTLSQQR